MTRLRYRKRLAVGYGKTLLFFDGDGSVANVLDFLSIETKALDETETRVSQSR
jgi:hypothetical protein